MSKLKRLFKSWRFVLLLVVVLLSVLAIHPTLSDEGVAIRSILSNSSAALAGVPNPDPQVQPVSRERILKVDGEPIDSVAEFYALTNFSINDINRTVTLQSSKGTFYEVVLLGRYRTKVLNETELVNVTRELFNETTNQTQNVTMSELVNKTERELVGLRPFGISVFDAPSNNLRKGLDLSGGTRVILQPEEKVDETQLDLIVERIKQRLNGFGLSDITVRSASDWVGNDFIVVEVAGATEDEVRELVSRQGKFEAKIGNETVFIGGERDVTYVCTAADCSGLFGGCMPIEGGYSCGFRFSIAISPEAAARHAEATRGLQVVTEQGQGYLSESLELYLDDNLMDTLRISADLRGRDVTDISISGGGQGRTRSEAGQNTLDQMRKLQTILQTGSLPVSLEVVKTDTISPKLGDAFVRSAVLIAALAILAVAAVVVARYRDVTLALPISVTMLSEIIIILGAAAVFRTNLDLAAIAGILIAVGTGVDHQIVIADETIFGERVGLYSWKERLKRAFFIIFAAAFTTIFAMVPLFLAGAGLLRGFAMTTIIGVLIGILITRPAYASMVEILYEE